MISYFPVVTGSLSVSGSVNISGGITASGGISISGSIDSASFASTASFVALAQSASNAVSAQTASFANTLTVAGNLTAQTLVVQTITSSVDFVTGSTRFGSSLSTSTHQFTGSIYHTGSTATFTGNVGIGITNPGVDLEVLNTIKARTQVYVGNNAANSKLEFQTGGSTNYAGSINTNSNVDLLFINGGAGANYNSGSGISLVGADRYGTKTAGMLTLYAGNAVNNTSYGFISMETSGSERLRINYGGQLLINTISTGYNNPMLFVSSSAGVCVPLQVVADSSGRLIRFYNSDYNNSNTGTDIRMGFSAGSGATSFNMQVYTAGETAAGNLVLQPSYGYVGVGTASPTNTLQVNGNIQFGHNGYIRNTTTTINGTSTTSDIFRFLNSAGSLIGGGTISGKLYISVVDTATGGNQSQFEYRILSSGNGTAQLAFTQVAANVRGTSPAATIAAVNDGGGGNIKIQLTTQSSGISGAYVFCTFIGHL
jgi:hypothetical protein